MHGDFEIEPGAGGPPPLRLLMYRVKLCWRANRGPMVATALSGFHQRDRQYAGAVVDFPETALLVAQQPTHVLAEPDCPVDWPALTFDFQPSSIIFKSRAACGSSELHHAFRKSRQEITGTRCLNDESLDIAVVL